MSTELPYDYFTCCPRKNVWILITISMHGRGAGCANAKVGAVVAKLLEEIECEKKQSIERRQHHAMIFEEATKERERQKQLLLEQKTREENEIRVRLLR